MRRKAPASGVKPASRNWGTDQQLFAITKHAEHLKRRMREKRFPPAHTVMTTSKLRIVFMGTPDFAAKILRAVAAWEGGEVTAAYAQPDRPAGRGRSRTSRPRRGNWAFLSFSR